ATDLPCRAPRLLPRRDGVSPRAGGPGLRADDAAVHGRPRAGHGRQGQPSLPDGQARAAHVLALGGRRVRADQAHPGGSDPPDVPPDERRQPPEGLDVHRRRAGRHAFPPGRAGV
ncbi:MAG: Transcriptional regulator, partial [uncultured Solirubrobacteraceae bacterium]